MDSENNPASLVVSSAVNSASAAVQAEPAAVQSAPATRDLAPAARDLAPAAFDSAPAALDSAPAAFVESITTHDISVDGGADLESGLPSLSSTQGRDAGRSTMAVQLNSGNLEFRIDTAVDHNLELVVLSAKLELTTQMLADTTRRLEEAMYRVGQLEAELGRQGAQS